MIGGAGVRGHVTSEGRNPPQDPGHKSNPRHPPCSYKLRRGGIAPMYASGGWKIRLIDFLGHPLEKALLDSVGIAVRNERAGAK